MENLYYKGLEQIKTDSQQWEAFIKPLHTVVIAGPGSGKTHILSLKIAQLVREEIQFPQGIACLTYTRVMAHEILKRLQTLGISEHRNVLVSTVHGFCLQEVIYPFAKILATNFPTPIRIASKAIQDECLDLARKKVEGIAYQLNTDEYDPFQRTFNIYRRQRLDQPFETWKDNQEYGQIISFYEQYLLEKGYVDFDIIVRVALNWIMEHDIVRQSLYSRFPYFAVDEYQDLGYPLFRIVTELLDKTAIRLFAIGDPDQCIYDFAGTKPEYLYQLAARLDMKPVVELMQNHRSPQEIIEISSIILGKSKGCFSKLTGGKCRVIECYDEIQQFQQSAYLVEQYLKRGVSLHNIVIVHRNREPLKRIALELHKKSLPFIFDQHPSYNRNFTIIRWLENTAYWCAKGCLVEAQMGIHIRTTLDELYKAWCQFAQHNIDLVNIDITEDRRIHFTQALWNSRGENQNLCQWLALITKQLDIDTTLKEYGNIYPDEVEEYYKLVKLVSPGGELEKYTLNEFANLSPGVQLTTLHSSKGMEFEIVIINGIEDIKDTENERRLFYVGATRAKRELCLLYSTLANSFGRKYEYSYPSHIEQLRSQYIPVYKTNISFERCNRIVT